ncbi:MAG: hypothetical protein J6L60_07610 [Bacteroidaceae bacterium]|nr:hypothetical protein [Bacteroidaceae bacterium]
MKNKESMNENTFYEEVNSSDRVNENKGAKIPHEKKKEKDSTWRKAGVSMGLGVLLGSTSSFVTPDHISSNPETQDISDDSSIEEHSPVWADNQIKIATAVSDEMSFSQAFATARAEVGAGGAFEWKGNVYSTYTAEEWNGMSAEEKNEYNTHFNWESHGMTTAQTPEASTSPIVEPLAEESHISEASNTESQIAEVESPENTANEIETDFDLALGLSAILGVDDLLLDENSIVTNQEVPAVPIQVANGGHPTWSDGKIEIATNVTDEMSFSQAFSVARAEVGAGGAFEWRGKVYNTFFAEEWKGMSSTERSEYMAHFNWSQQGETQSSVSSSVQQADSTEVSDQPIVEVDVQETNPEVEILGVVHDSETGANLGLMTDGEQDFLFVDVDDNGEFDVVVSYENNGGEMPDEINVDVPTAHLSVSDFESNSFGGGSMYASEDDTVDYINDAETSYDI